MVFVYNLHLWMGENKRFGIKGSEVSIVIEVLKKEVHYVEKTSLYFDPPAHCLTCPLLCPGESI